MKKFSFLLLLIALILVIAACTQENGQSEEESGNAIEEETTENVEGTMSTEEQPYIVGIDTSYAPFEFQQGGEYTGIDIELINAIAELQGFEIELSPMNFDEIIPALEAGDLDIAIAGMSITEERQEVVEFSEPYFDAGLALAVAVDNADIDSVEDLEEKIVGVKNGTTGSKFLHDNSEEFGYRISSFDESPTMFAEMENGHLDAIVEDYPVVAYAMSTKDLEIKIVEERLTDEQYGIAVLKDENEELLEQINAGLQELRDSGQYEEILNKYYIP
ncbi:polar amino acid transport system substrate-binding protein [Planomicrobium stackebrandtii]|uniref:Polar amino acid transport system substrate-binding protein n=1 Tax=Planomicrobium stackebrandtii TaxID=253160 RepID=A0ABU0GXR9_9BACL|nr:transporter substrate-binding domain-containing protein [Planomicrobium stackebrandtii]MDQ0429729.1 polar amino acid transport system substrate-binding protein [Planomicrobium stackebrandtii]